MFFNLLTNYYWIRTFEKKKKEKKKLYSGLNFIYLFGLNFPKVIPRRRPIPPKTESDINAD